MPSRRSHSRSRSRDRSRSRSLERQRALPYDAQPISQNDYFLKSSEFRVWLKEEKGKYFDELSSEKAHSYFRKFVKAWNRGKLSSALYKGVDPTAQSSTAYKWAIKTSGDDVRKMRDARSEVQTVNYGKPNAAGSSSTEPSRPSRTVGPTLPSREDMLLARESAEELEAVERGHKRKRDRAEAKERVEDMVGPKEVGRAGMLDAKRARRDADRAFRDRGDEGLELDEASLGLGGGDSFQERIRQRDAAKKRGEEKKHGPREDRVTAVKERTDAIRQKDAATMDMFKRMAAERFG